MSRFLKPPNLVTNPYLNINTTGWTTQPTATGSVTLGASSEGGNLVATGLTAGAFEYLLHSVRFKVARGSRYIIRFRYRRNTSASKPLAYRLNVYTAETGTTQHNSWVINGTTYGPDLEGQTTTQELCLGNVGEWVTKEVLSVPAPDGYAYIRFYASDDTLTSSGTSYSYTLTDFQVVREDAANLRLEIETTPPAGTLANLIQNPSGAQGGFGWVTPVVGSTMQGLNDGAFTNNRVALEYLSAANAGGNYFLSEPYAVTPGRFIGASWVCPYNANAHKARIDFLNSSKVLLSSTSYTATLASGSDRKYLNVTSAIPAGAAYAQLRFDLINTDGTARTVAGSKLSLYEVAMAQDTTQTPVNNLAFSEPVFWSNILSPTHEIQIQREELSAGTMSAEVLDATLDPAVSATIRPGKRVRLTTFNNDSQVFEPLFTGKVTEANVAYELLRTDNSRARISISAQDNAQTLANTPRSQGTRYIDVLPFLLEGAGVPWVCNGSSQQVGTMTPDSLNDNASLLDQVALTRDTALGYAWVDHNNVLQVWEDFAFRVDKNVFVNGNFDSGATTGWTATTNCSLGIFSAQYPNGLLITSTAAGTSVVTSPMSPATAGLVHEFAYTTVSIGAQRTMTLQPRWHNAAGTVIGTAATQTTTVGADTTSGLVWNALAPAGATQASLVITILGNAANEQHVLDNFILSPVPVLLDESVYSELDVSYNTSRCINQVMVKFIRYNSATKETEEIPYGPYADSASVAEWGPRQAEFTVQGTEDATSIQRFAQRVLRANAVPRVTINSLTMPIVDSSGLVASRALTELYDRVQVRNTSRGLNEAMRVTGIRHTITPEKWLVGLDFSTSESVAQPTLVPSPPAGFATDGTWLTPALLNGYTAASAAQTPQYMRKNGIVYIRGAVTRNSAADGAAVFTLPVGYRPGTQEWRYTNDTLPASTTSSRITVSAANGNVQCYSKLNTSVPTHYYLHGNFPAEA